MINEYSKIIAVDFDGTIVEDKYPAIGKPVIFAFETLRKLQEDGHRLILWTYRHGSRLNEALDFCRQHGIEFYAVNHSFAEEEFDVKTASRKINADIFIDDRNVGGFPGWGEIYQMISRSSTDTGSDPERNKKKKKGFFRF